MGNSTVKIYNATEMILDVTLSQVGPLYYENRLQPGKCFERVVGKVWFTITAKCYTGQDNIYTDWSVAAPIVAVSVAWVSPVVGAVVTGAVAATASSRTNGMSALVGSKGDGTELTFSCKVTDDEVRRVISNFTLSSPGWYFGSDRTLYITGGPSRSDVQRDSSTFQRVVLEDCELPPLYISEKRPAGFIAKN